GPRRPSGRRVPGPPASPPRSVRTRDRDGDPSVPRTPSVSCLPVVVLRRRSPTALLTLLRSRRTTLLLTRTALLWRLPLLRRLRRRAPLPLTLLRLPRVLRLARLSRLTAVRRLPGRRLLRLPRVLPRLTAVLT